MSLHIGALDRIGLVRIEPTSTFVVLVHKRSGALFLTDHHKILVVWPAL